MNIQHPKQVFVRTLKRAMFAQLAFMCVVYGTSHGDNQMLVAHVVCALTAIIAFLIAILSVANAEQRLHQEWVDSQRASIHYPAGAAFKARMVQSEHGRAPGPYHSRVDEFA